MKPLKAGIQMTITEQSSMTLTATETSGGSRKVSVTAVIMMVLAVVFAGLAYTTTSQVMVGIWSIGLMLTLILLGAHVGVAMGMSGVYAIWVIHGSDGLFGALSNIPYDNVSSWSISVLPMFIFMGFVLWRSSLTTRLFDGAGKWLNWMPGGLAITANVAGSAMGAASGSSVGIAYALGRIAIPEMLRAGYPKRLSLTSILMAGSGGQLIPPSIIMVVYAGVAGTSVGQQILAGLLPGLLLVTAYLIYLLALSFVQRKKFTGGDKSRVTWAERWRSLKDLWQIPLVIAVVVGGMFAGLFTATEAGAVGAFMAVVLLFIYRGRQSGASLWNATTESAASVGSIFLLLVGSAILARAFAVTGLAQETTTLIMESDLSRWQFLLILIVFYIFLGLFLDPISMILLTVPLLLPAMSAMGIDPIWFGVFVVLMGELAIVTPPVGVMLFVIHRISQNKEVNLGQSISLTDVMRSALAFIPIVVILALILIAWPEIATILPEISFAE